MLSYFIYILAYHVILIDFECLGIFFTILIQFVSFQYNCFLSFFNKTMSNSFLCAQNSSGGENYTGHGMKSMKEKSFL